MGGAQRREDELSVRAPARLELAETRSAQRLIQDLLAHVDTALIRIAPARDQARAPAAQHVETIAEHDAILRVGRLLDQLRLRPNTDIAEIARGHASLSDRDTRAAFMHTLRTIVDPTGQRVSANDRLYLAEEVPFLIIWGKRDSIIPVSHAYAVHERVPSSRLEIFERAGHFPQLDDPVRFARILLDFIDGTEPAELDFTDDDLADLRRRLLAGAEGAVAG
jgi:pimeloyl-ACP methyl ester carboxylesterase